MAWDNEDVKDIIQGIDATDNHPTGAGYPWGWQGGLFCVDCQERIQITDLDAEGRHPACGEVIVGQIDRMKRIGRKIRENERVCDCSHTISKHAMGSPHGCRVWGCDCSAFTKAESPSD